MAESEVLYFNLEGSTHLKLDSILSVQSLSVARSLGDKAGIPSVLFAGRNVMKNCEY